MIMDIIFGIFLINILEELVIIMSIISDIFYQDGIKIIIQPGGSIRDQEVINVANKAKIKMLFTGVRHFNH